MSAQALTDVRLYYDGADLSGQSNKVTAAVSLGVGDATTFGSGKWEECAGLLFSHTSSLDGFWAAGSAGLPDDVQWANISNNGVAETISPNIAGAANPSPGDLAYVAKSQQTAFKLFGQLGELIPYSLDTKGNGPMLRGQILHPNGTARTTSGNGTGVQIGAVTALQKMSVNLHVHSATGTSITVKLQSSVDNTFSAPTDRGTFPAATVVGGKTLTIAGAVTDTWWRAVWTLAGGSPSYLFTVAAAIGPI